LERSPNFTEKDQQRIAMNSRRLHAFLFIGLNIFLSQNVFSLQTGEKTECFEQAKLGIFIHWGTYSVNGIDEYWSFFNDYLSHEDWG